MSSEIPLPATAIHLDPASSAISRLDKPYPPAATGGLGSEESEMMPGSIDIIIPYSDRVITISSPLDQQGLVLSAADRLNIARFVGLTVRQAAYRMLDPWISSQTIADQTTEMPMNDHGIRQSLRKLVSLGAAEQSTSLGYRLKVPIKKMEEMLTSETDFELPEGKDDLWEDPEIFPHHYEAMLLAIFDLLRQEGSVKISDIPDEWIADTVVESRSGLKKILYLLSAQKYSPIKRDLRKGAVYEFSLKDLSIAERFRQRQQFEYHIIPQLISSEQNDRDGIEAEARKEVALSQRYTLHPVTLITPGLATPLALSPEMIRRLAQVCLVMKAKLRKSQVPEFFLNDLVEQFSGSTSYSEYLMLMRKLVAAQIFSRDKRGMFPYSLNIPLADLQALVEGDDSRTLSAPTGDLWRDQLLFKPAEIMIIGEVTRIIEQDGQFVTRDHLHEVARRIGVGKSRINFVLKNRLSRGPQTPFVARRKIGNKGFVAYDMRGSQAAYIKEMLTMADAVFDMYAVPDPSISPAGILRFTEPPIGLKKDWEALGHRSNRHAEDTSEQDKFSRVLATLTTSFKRREILDSSGNPIYVGRLPATVGDLVPSLIHLGFTEPGLIADFIEIARERGTLTLDETVRLLESENPKQPYVQQIKRTLVDLVAGRRVGLDKIKRISYYDARLSLEHRLATLERRRQPLPGVVFEDSHSDRLSPVAVHELVNESLRQLFDQRVAQFMNSDAGIGGHLDLSELSGTDSLESRVYFNTLWLFLQKSGLVIGDPFSSRRLLTLSGYQLARVYRMLRNQVALSGEPIDSQLLMIGTAIRQVAYEEISKEEDGTKRRRNIYYQTLFRQLFNVHLPQDED